MGMRCYMMFFLLIGTVSGFAQVTDAQSNPQIIDSLLEISGKFADKGEFDKALEINTAAAALALKLFGEESAPYAKACFNIGMLLYHQDDPGAIIWYQKSLVIWEKVSGQESAVYAKNLYYLGNAHRYAGDNEQAKPFYLEALAIQEKILGKSDRARLKTLKNLASLYRDMGDTDGAETLYLEAKGIYINTLGTELDDYFELLNSLGRLYEKTENYFDLLPVAQEIVAFTQKKSGEESPQYAEALFLLGDAYKETWDLEKAQKLYQEGLDIFEKAVGKAHKTYAYAVNNLARVYLRTGDLVGAELRFVEAKDIYEKLEGKESKSYAHLLSNIAILYHEKGAYKKAIAYDTEALDIYAKRVGKQSHNYGNTLQNLAILYLDLGDFERAESLFKEAVQIFENLYGTAHPRYAHALRSLAQLNLEKGQIGNSAEILTKVLDVLSKTVGKHSPDYADALDDMAKLNMQQGNFKETEALLLESKDIMAKARGEEGPSYAAALSRLAAFYNHTNRFQEAAAYYVALNKLNRLFIEKSAVYTSEHEMLGYLQFFESDFAKFLSFTQAHPDPDLIRQNFDNALFLNGLVLQNAQILARAISNADSLTQDIYEKWQGCHRRLAKRYVRPIKEHKRIEPVEQEAEGYEKMLQLRLPEFQESRKIPHWQDVAKQLKSNEVALEFLHYRRYNPGPTDSIQYAALVLRAGWDAPKMVLLFEEKSLDSLLNTNGARKADFVAQVYAIPDRGVVVSAKAQKSLYELVWTPLEAVLHEKGADSPAIEKIYFSPSGLLHRINLAAVPISADSTLADRYHLVEMGSTRQVLSENNVAFQHQDAMLFGGITYALDTSLINDGSQEKDRGNQPDHISDQGARSTSWNYLPGTEKEVTILEQIIKDSGFQIQSFKGAAATEEVFKKIGSNGTPSPRILHLATHGFFFPDPKQSSDGKQLPIDENETGFKTSNNPLIRSGILMAGADFAWNSGKPLEKGMENGILTAYEISHMDLTNTELVVLSACETGLGDIEGNEGVFGLQRAFKIAGAKYLIMSLWQVPDKQTSLLMRAFYKNWLEDKMDIPEAFWAAQKALREIGLDPYQWAGFVLME